VSEDLMPADAGVVDWTERDLHAWQILRPLLDAGDYLPWSTGAMRPAGLVEVCNEIVLGGRQQIVELGSGISSVVLARLLRSRGGRLDAIEHDERWADWVTGQLRRESLAEHAHVTHAPLQPSASSAGGLPWYADSALRHVAGGGIIDLLIVDGPPAFEPAAALARLPGLPALLDRLAPDAVVILDDIARPGEQEVVRRWERETPLRFELCRPAGVAIGRRPAD
jgi:predicted O-methyltransferase YrrM